MANIQIKGLVPGKSYDVQIRAKDGASFSDWSNKFTFTATADTTAPSTPSAALVLVSNNSADYLNTLTTRVKINGYTSASQVIETDTAYFEVYAASVNVASSATKLGDVRYARVDGVNSEATLTVPVSGTASIVAPTNVLTSLYFFIRAVDRSGNKSEFSSGVLPQTTTYFANAYISDLSADKIVTGTLQANQQISVGNTTPIVIKSNASSPLGQLYSGTGASANANTPFYLDTAGNFTLSDTVKFTSGGASIAGWTVTASSLYSGTGTSYVALANSGLYSFWAGNSTAANAPFSITNTGSLKAVTGQISNWLISTSSLSYQSASGRVDFYPSTNIQSVEIPPGSGTFVNYQTSNFNLSTYYEDISGGGTTSGVSIYTVNTPWTYGMSSGGIQSDFYISATEFHFNGNATSFYTNWSPAPGTKKGFFIDVDSGQNNQIYFGSATSNTIINFNDVPTKAVQGGSTTVTASYAVAAGAFVQVTFATPFNSVPYVTVSLSTAPGGTATLVPRAISTTASGFNLYVYNVGSSSIASVGVGVAWIAAGS
jgi:hypothetical protein